MDSVYKGTLKQWHEDKGFGFIQPESGNRDIFIHISALKKMSRNPIIGDVIFYQIHTQNDGKNRAVNAKIEGITEVKQRAKRKSATTHKSKLLPFVLLIFAGLFVFNNLTKKNKLSETKIVSLTPTPKQQVNFRCDGRQHCSQMNSRAEAEFFTRNCPNTKMDGDHDGVPCESDSRF